MENTQIYVAWSTVPAGERDYVAVFPWIHSHQHCYNRLLSFITEQLSLHPLGGKLRTRTIGEFKEET